MAKLSTKNLSSDTISTPKILQPGNRVVKILSVELEKPIYKKEDANDPDPYYVNLNVEGPDLGTDFIGFLFDKNDPSKGKYKGQVGTVRGSRYAFANVTFKGGTRVKKGTEGGVLVERDDSILKLIRNLCKEMNMLDWIEANDEKHETIESYIEQFNKDKPFANKWIRVCLGGKEYKNKSGYINYNLFLPKDIPIVELESVPEEKSRIVKFSKEKHILIKDTENIKPVHAFEEEEKPRAIAKKLDSSFDL